LVTCLNIECFLAFRSSNILVGFLEWFKRQPVHVLASLYATNKSSGSGSPPALSSAFGSPSSNELRKPKLSHSALVLLLERGRPCARRILVASSPLHQSECLSFPLVLGMHYPLFLYYLSILMINRPGRGRGHGL